MGPQSPETSAFPTMEQNTRGCKICRRRKSHSFDKHDHQKQREFYEELGKRGGSRVHDLIEKGKQAEGENGRLRQTPRGGNKKKRIPRG